MHHHVLEIESTAQPIDMAYRRLAPEHWKCRFDQRFKGHPAQRARYDASLKKSNSTSATVATAGTDDCIGFRRYDFILCDRFENRQCLFHFFEFFRYSPVLLGVRIICLRAMDELFVGHIPKRFLDGLG